MSRRVARNDARTPTERVSARLLTRFDAALRARRKLLADRDTNAIRLFHGQADGIDGLVIEQFADVLVVQCHQGRLSLLEPQVRELCEHAMHKTAAVAVYRKVFLRDRGRAMAERGDSTRDLQPWIGAAVEPRIGILENGMRLFIRPYDGLATGLYLDQRDNRRRVRGWARDRGVLNVFCYTCGFSVAAALGGAAETVNVDVSRKYLEWGRHNFAANQISLDRHRFVCADALDYLKRARKRGQRFDLIILDPPSFARTKRPAKVFVLDDALPTLLAEAVNRLAAGGRLMVSTNHRGISAAELTRRVKHAGRRRDLSITVRAPLPSDFAGDRDYAKTVVARLR